MIICDWCGDRITGDDIPERITYENYDVHDDCYEDAIYYVERLQGIDIDDAQLGRIVRLLEQ